MIRQGDKIEILPAFQDPGDAAFDWYAIEDEDGGRVRIAAPSADLPLTPNYVVRTDMIRKI